MHLSFASPWVNALDTPGEPTGTQGEWYSFGISFFPTAEGSCLVLEMTPLDHRDIHSWFKAVQGEKCLTWYHGQCVKMSKSVKKIGYICLLFLPMKSK